jgi:hypothetical protein
MPIQNAVKPAKNRGETFLRPILATYERRKGQTDVESEERGSAAALCDGRPAFMIRPLRAP